MDPFSGNSHTAKLKNQHEATETPEATETQKPVVEGKVTTRKKTLGRKFKELFIAEGEHFRDWFIDEMLMPTIRGMIVTVANQVSAGFVQGLEEKLNPGQRSSITRPPSGNAGPIPYNRYSSNATVVSSTMNPVMASNSYQPVVRHSNDVQEVIFQDRQDAVRVILSLEGAVDSHGYATVGDFYSCVPGMAIKNTDHEWGWYDLTRARPVPIRGGGYVISFPRPEAITIGR